MISLTEDQKQFLIQSALQFDKACTIAKAYCTNIDDEGIPCEECIRKELKILRQPQKSVDASDRVGY